MGWGGVRIIPNMSRATLHDLQLIFVLRYMIFIDLRATLHDLPLNFMPRYMIFTCTLTDEDGVGLGWGGVGIIPNMSRATLHDLHLIFVLRYMIFH